jgi:phosphatidylserine/phosphatidylglycerophosphate/cardiolipin synthase-like enzyme
VLSVRSVHPTRRFRKRLQCQSELRRAHVQVTTGDVLGSFVAAVTRTRRRLRRLTIVSPWISYGEDFPLARLLQRAERDHAAVVLVTRPPTTESHAAAVEAVEANSRGRVFLNERLHAKLYVCQEHGAPGFAVVGSANMTSASAQLDELAIVIRPIGTGRRLISGLAGTSVLQLARRGRHTGPRHTRHTRRERRLG